MYIIRYEHSEVTEESVTAIANVTYNGNIIIDNVCNFCRTFSFVYMLLYNAWIHVHTCTQIPL